MGFNTYADREDPELWAVSNNVYLSASPPVRFDRALWDESVEAMVAVGINAAVIAPAEVLCFESRLELAAEGASPHEYRRGRPSAGCLRARSLTDRTCAIPGPKAKWCRY